MIYIDFKQRLAALQDALVREYTEHQETKRTCLALLQALQEIRTELVTYCQTDQISLETLANITVIVSKTLRENGGGSKTDTDDEDHE